MLARVIGRRLAEGQGDLGARRTAIVVLGAAVLPRGAPSPALARRIGHAAWLFHAGRAGTVIGTGGEGAWPPAEARVIRDRLVAVGVPEAAILEEDGSRSTFENALNAIAMMRARGLGPALVVSEGYHLPRALMTFRLLGMPATGSAPFGRGESPRAAWVRAHLREAVALPVYFARLLAWRARNRPP